MSTVVSLIAFPLLALAWLGVVLLILRDPSHQETPWRVFRRLPLVVQAIAWVLALPVVLGIWIWHTRWPFVARVILVAGLALVSLNVFFPGGSLLGGQ